MFKKDRINKKKHPAAVSQKRKPEQDTARAMLKEALDVNQTELFFSSSWIPYGYFPHGMWFMY